MNNLVGVPSLDLVNWTLAVEIKFYLLFAMAHRTILRFPARSVLCVGAVAVLLCAAVPWALAAAPGQNAPKLLRAVALDWQYLPFMLVGTLFHLHWRDRMSTGRLVGLAAAALALTGVAFRLVEIPVEFGTVLPNYLGATALFALAYGLRRRINGTAVTRWLAAVSYPLYLVHSLLGYVLLNWLLMGLGWGYLPALALTVATVLGVAAVLHVVLEQPSIEAGRRLGRSSGRRPGEAAATAP